jgi:uncharacterized protein
MLSFDIRELEQRAASVDGELAADDDVWQETDPRPVATIHATGRLSKAGSGRFYWSGHIEGAAEAPCRRCLTTVESPVSEDVHLLFTESGDEDADDPDVFRIPPRAHAIDLRPAIREQWLLAVPEFPLCREDCKGLCPKCGADLNAGPCQCPPETDHRWDALRQVRDASSS